MRRLLGFIFAMTLLAELYADEGLRKDMPEPYKDDDGNSYFCIKNGDDLSILRYGGFGASSAELARPIKSGKNLGKRCLRDIKGISGLNEKCFRLEYNDDSFEYADIGSVFALNEDYCGWYDGMMHVQRTYFEVLGRGSDRILVYRTKYEAIEAPRYY